MYKVTIKTISNSMLKPQELPNSLSRQESEVIDGTANMVVSAIPTSATTGRFKLMKAGKTLDGAARRIARNKELVRTKKINTAI